jgi:predicted nucleotidyltransferase
MTCPPIQISARHWEIVADVLGRHVPGCMVWAFGSRAAGRAAAYSDLDLAVLGPGPLSLSTIAALAADFEESALPFKVDTLDWATTAPSFRKMIEAHRVLVQAGSPAVATQVLDEGFDRTPA